MDDIISVNNSENALLINSNVQQSYSAGRFNNTIQVFYISDIHLEHHIDTSNSIDEQLDSIISDLLNADVFEQLITFSRREQFFFFGGDISSDFELYKEFFIKFESRVPADRIPIIVVLGNHELKPFKSLEEAVSQYDSFFQQHNIIFLHNTSVTFSSFTPCTIYGGIGFAKYNEKFNVTTIPNTTPRMTREKEIGESERFYEEYQKITEKYSKRYTDEGKFKYPANIFITLSHFPVKDWLPNQKTDSACIYFTGHTHHDDSIHTDRINIFADNQIGYRNPIRFKSCILGGIYNPFVDYDDGIHQITLKQYCDFYYFNGIHIRHCKNIEGYLGKVSAKFYMLKRNGMYCFLLSNDKNEVKICSGGKYKSIEYKADINYFYDRFIGICNKYISLLGPYRSFQNKVASEIKALGFWGRIHGTIVDINELNHIMINPLDGKMTFYFSRIFGEIYTFPSLIDLLRESTALFDSDKKETAIKKLSSSAGGTISLLNKKSEDLSDQYCYHYLDISNSLYSVSRIMCNFQKLFEMGTLTVWDESLFSELLTEGENKTVLQSPKNEQ